MPSYTQLEPSSFQTLGIVTPTFTGSGSFFSTSLFVYTLLFTAIIGAAFYEYVLVGIYRMEASENGIRKSNETFKRTTLGLLGVFALFLIIAALNKNLLTGNVDLSAVKVDTRTVGGSTVATQPIVTQPQTPPSDGSYAARKASHDLIVSRLAPSGIHTNHNDASCTEAQFKERTPSCTSLAYLPEETVQMLLKINASCKCSLIISGGTEPGHSSHGENRRPVDLKINGSKSTTDALYNYLRSVTTEGSETTGCYAVFRYSSFTFCDEKPRSNSTWAPHFHIS